MHLEGTTEDGFGIEDALCIIKQDFLQDMASVYVPLVRLLENSNGFDDGVYQLLDGDMSKGGIERYVNSMLVRDIRSAGMKYSYFREKDSLVREKLGITVDTREIYLELRSEYLFLLQMGGLSAFMTGLGPNIKPRDRGISLNIF
jgi:hypothetical protein